MPDFLNPNLGVCVIGGGGGRVILPPCWFPLNNSKRLKLQPWHFSAFSKILLEPFLPNLVPLTCPSLQILGDLITDVSISNLRISGQSLIKENCRNSRTRNDIDMKFGSVTKLDKKNKTTSKKVDDDVISQNCDIIIISPIYDQFGTIQKPDYRRMVCKIYVFISSNLISYKNWKQD